MARRQTEPAEEQKGLGEFGTRYRLLAYQYLSRRYRPVGVLLFFVGLLAQLPTLIPELRYENAIITYQQLSVLGLGLLGVGIIMWFVARQEARSAYVQCQPKFLIINTASGRTAIAYRRIIATKPVKVVSLYDPKSLKGRDRAILKPLANEIALEMELNEYPIDEKKLRRRLSKYLFTPRQTGFLLIVKGSGNLNREIGEFKDRLREGDRLGEYRDPLARMSQR